jgi:DNA repair protein RecN (Recombination protein N)
VFDEIDANVGGETAAKVGEKMLQIARKHQVLCITHLAPVAAAAQNHLVVTKQVRENRTVIEVASPGAEERVDEIARMLGGRSRAALDHAQTLLQKG